jgi:1,4-alpha-glucan branching enzyme
MIKKTNKKTVRQVTSVLKAAEPAKDNPTTVRSKASPRCEVTFALYEPRAEQVFLCGAFNGWVPNATPLTRKPNRDWKTTLALAPGRYEYKFVVDGAWKPDPRASETVSNGFGTLNSVVEVKA